MSYILRSFQPDDVAQLLTLNTASVPAVSELDETELLTLLSQSHRALIAVDEAAPEVVLGFAVVFTAGADYASENYRWFAARSSDFLYVDRIVVAEGSRGEGLGQLLYSAVFDAARDEGVPEVFCEVNLEPPNPESMAFHTRLGFHEVGQQSTKNATVVVALLAASV